MARSRVRDRQAYRGAERVVLRCPTCDKRLVDGFDADGVLDMARPNPNVSVDRPRGMESVQRPDDVTITCPCGQMWHGTMPQLHATVVTATRARMRWAHLPASGTVSAD